MEISHQNYSDVLTSSKYDYYACLSDATIRTDDGSDFRIHRILLAQRSLYFRSLFSADSNVLEFGVGDIDSSTLNKILLYVYTGRLSLKKKNICDLLIASDYLSIEDLVKECKIYATRNTTTKNCLKLLNTTLRHEKLDLLEHCKRFVKVRLEDILLVPNNQWGTLPVQVVKELLIDDSLNVKSERSVWQAILQWVSVVPAKRSHFLPELIQCLRLGDTVDDLVGEIFSHPVVVNTPLCNELSPKLLKESSTSGLEETTDDAQYRKREEYRLRLPRSIHAVAHYPLDAEIETWKYLYITYDGKLDYWRKLSYLPFRPTYMMHMDKYIYMFNTSIPNLSKSYDIVEQRLFEIPPMIEPRYDYYVVVLRGKIYAVGGRISMYNYVNTIESYDKETNMWTRIKPMLSTCDVRSGAVAFNGRLYVFGVYKNKVPLTMMIQEYDPESRTWRLMTPTHSLFQCFNVVVYRQHIVILGGIGPTEMSSMYVAHYNPNTNEWNTQPDLPYDYSYPKAHVVAGTLFVFDADEDDCTADPPVYWDVHNEEWRVIDKSSPFYRLKDYEFCSIDDVEVIKKVVQRKNTHRIKWKRSLFAEDNSIIQ